MTAGTRPTGFLTKLTKLTKPAKLAGLAGVALTIGCATKPSDFYAFDEVCATLPNAANSKLVLSPASDDWFQIYESAPGVYSIMEPFHAQGTISHLIVGSERALLFDTGIGLLPIRPVVERLTSLPVTVLNSHTHYDHVGGNAEFSSILAIDSPYTRANMRGFASTRIAQDFTDASFCNGAPPGIDLGTVHTRPWEATQWVTDGDVIDLGDRQLEVLHVPGHTPDAVALYDKAHQLLFTGDSFYDDEIWLFVPETNIDEYDKSIRRLSALEPKVRYLLGAHTSARVEAGRLHSLQSAVAKLRAGDYAGKLRKHGPSLLHVGDVEFMTSKQVLEGRQMDTTSGGSGLDVWK